jgi:hypothetical protein
MKNDRRVDLRPGFFGLALAVTIDFPTMLHG